MNIRGRWVLISSCLSSYQQNLAQSVVVRETSGDFAALIVGMPSLFPPRIFLGTASGTLLIFLFVGGPAPRFGIRDAQNALGGHAKTKRDSSRKNHAMPKSTSTTQADAFAPVKHAGCKHRTGANAEEDGRPAPLGTTHFALARCKRDKHGTAVAR